MANYCCTIRTNYFHVNDDAIFRDIMSRAYSSEGEINLWEEKDADGRTVFGFGVYGGIGGLANSDDDEIDDSSYDDFINALQSCVADDDAIIIFESGAEKMRYLVGSATIITRSGYKYIEIGETAVHAAAEILHDPSWRTKYTY